MRLHSAELSDFRVPDDGVGVVPSSPFRHRVDLVQRLHPQGAPQPLPSLLQSGGLGARCLVQSLGQAGGAGVCSNGDDRVGRGRHALPQAGTDRLRHGDAPRSVDLQPCEASDQLGARLGRGDIDRPLSLLGPDKSLELGDRLSTVSQSTRSDQGKEEEPEEGQEAEAAEAGPQPPHSSGFPSES
jgi:hypothetical protein